MKKILFIIISVLFIYSCKFADDGYSFHRENDKGTYITRKNVSMYISGIPDTATTIRDVYAILYERLTYANNTEDSILIFGHCWSTLPEPRVVDTMSVQYMIDADEDGNPDGFVDTLQVGSEFTSALGNLKPETHYYARSFVITGKMLDGQLVHKDTAYNPVEYEFTTDKPRDVWEIRSEYAGDFIKDAISFEYNDMLYVGLGNTDFGVDKTIYRYDPVSNQWTQAATFPGSDLSGSVAFVLKNVRVSFGVYKDFVYIGTGYSVTGVDTTSEKEMWRWNFVDEWVKLQNGSEFAGLPRRNAIAFSLNGIGYVAQGRGTSGALFEDVYKFDPEVTDETHAQGTWTFINTFPPGPREGAACFVIENSAYMLGGRDESGVYKKDLYLFRQTSDGNGGWARKQDFPDKGRSEGVGFAIENLGYFGTGVDIDSLRSDFWRYNPYINQWDQRAYFGGRRRAQAIGQGLKFADDDYRGYIGTGKGYDQSDGYGGYENDFWHYRP